MNEDTILCTERHTQKNSTFRYSNFRSILPVCVTFYFPQASGPHSTPNRTDQKLDELDSSMMSPCGDVAPRVSLWLVHLQLHLDSPWTKLLEIHKYPPRVFWNLQTEIILELDLHDRWLEYEDGISRSRGEAYLQHVSLPKNEVHRFIKHSYITLRNECYLQVCWIKWSLLGKGVAWL